MKTINKILSITVLSSLAFTAFADSNTSPFSCQEQTASGMRSGLGLSQPFTCDTGLVFVQIVPGTSGQNVAYCMGSGQVKTASTSVCEQNPQYWAPYTGIRHDCRGSDEQCKVEIY